MKVVPFRTESANGLVKQIPERNGRALFGSGFERNGKSCVCGNTGYTYSMPKGIPSGGEPNPGWFQKGVDSRRQTRSRRLVPGHDVTYGEAMFRLSGKAISALDTILSDDSVPLKEKLKAAGMVLDRAFGAPVNRVQMEANVTQDRDPNETPTPALLARYGYPQDIGEHADPLAMQNALVAIALDHSKRMGEVLEGEFVEVEPEPVKAEVVDLSHGAREAITEKVQPGESDPLLDAMKTPWD